MAVVTRVLVMMVIPGGKDEEEGDTCIVHTRTT